jgi:hypothetical protein
MHLSGKIPVRKPGRESFSGDFACRFFARQRDFVVAHRLRRSRIRRELRDVTPITGRAAREGLEAHVC